MTLWGGRFDEPPDPVMWAFSADPIDRRLLHDDVVGSLAHVSMLGQVGLLDGTEVDELRRGLTTILADADTGRFAFLESDEDVHSAVERRLFELTGDVAGKLHTGRSRNDQVCLDMRLYLRRSVGGRISQIEDLMTALLDQAEAVGAAIVPSYTHLQQAQAVPLAHHLLAHAWMLLRDADRLRDCLNRIAVSPLGAGASGGSSLALDPAMVADELGFPAVFDNSLDAVGSRDFVAEFIFCCAQAMAGLSRLAEELVLWTTQEFDWVTFADRHTTGSSALPHKKNPDIAELVRGRAAIVSGDVTALLGLQKGLPLTYSRDLQEDKRAAFHADDTLAGALVALTAMVAGAVFDVPGPGPWVAALDLAEVLVERGVPFREAHQAVGHLVSSLDAAGRTFDDLSPEELGAAHDAFETGDLALLDAASSVARRRTPGGGSPKSVINQLAKLRASLHG